MNAATQTDDTQAAHAEIDRKAAEAKQYQVQLGNLERTVAEADQRLKNATAFKAHLTKRVTELRGLLLTLWGRAREVVNVDPATQALDCYQTILTAELAIKDWPRVEPVLRANLAEAQRTLAEFTKRQ